MDGDSLEDRQEGTKRGIAGAGGRKKREEVLWIWDSAPPRLVPLMEQGRYILFKIDVGS